MKLRALTVRQPWAQWLVSGAKPTENRSWPTRYRGRLLVHAGARHDPSAILFARAMGAAVPASVPAGIIGSVDIADCCDQAMHNRGCGCEWASPVSFHWQCADPWQIPEPVPCRGQLGLWRPPPDVLEAVRVQWVGA